jgi:hypothetical protein
VISEVRILDAINERRNDFLSQISDVGFHLRDNLRDKDAIGLRSHEVPHVHTVGMSRNLLKSQERESQIHTMRLSRREKMLADIFSRMDRIRDYALHPDLFGPSRTMDQIGKESCCNWTDQRTA